ncbi:MAG: T9SS type B sorting domain-containing protein, partial [Bacteroidota bacterium]
MRKHLLLITLVLLTFQSYSQTTSCAIDVTPMTGTICPGDSVLIVATANLINTNQAFNFNNSSVPTGWSTAGSTFFSAPCGPSPNNTPYYWASTSSGVPNITTAAFDVSCGGYIAFQMIYSMQGGSAPCEGPDQYNEGVSLQYSLNGGLTWIDIIYYAPNGTVLPSNPGTTAPGASGVTPFTSWSSFNVPIPAAALSPNTRFRWTQSSTSGTCCDNWGLDNIVINSSGFPCGTNAVVNWSTGLNDTTSFYMVPTNDTAFVAYVYDTLGNYQCESDTIYINVYNDAFTFTLVDTVSVNCTFGSAAVNVTNVSTAALQPVTYSWSTGSTSAYITLAGNGVPDTLTYYVDVVDACGITESDSVVLTVAQNLYVDAGPDQIICEGDQTTVTGTSANAVNWSNLVLDGVPFYPLASQYLYATVADGLGCSETDSLFVTVLDTTSSVLNITAVDSFILNSQLYNQSGVYTQVLPNYLGCDSTITLNLNILVSTASTDIQSHCDTYTWMDGITYTSSTNTPTWTINNVAGADSVITLDLTIRYATTGVDTQVACDNYLWIDGNNYTSSNTVAQHTLTNSVGCDSVVTLNLTMHYSDTTSESYPSCFTWDTIPYVTVYANQYGCDSTHTIYPIQIPYDLKPHADFIIKPNPAEVLFDPIAITNTSVTINSSSWISTPLDLNSTSTHLQFEPFEEDGNYEIQLMVTNETGCFDSITRILKVYQSNPIYLPNSFTPDGDEFNGVYRPIITPVDRVETFEFTIYNRYGEIFYQSFDPSAGWDGTFQNKQVPQGIYNWVLKATFVD